MFNQLWTDEITAQILSMWQSGMTGAQISLKLSVSRNSVFGKLSRMGAMRHPKASHNTTSKFIELHSGPVHLYNLGRAQCHWPVIRGDDNQWLFCAEGTGDLTKVYCKEHHARSVSTVRV